MTWIVLSALSLIGWIYLTFGRSFYWLADVRLGDSPPPAVWPEVAAVVPARNEAETIGPVVASHMESDYPGALSVIVVDDSSTDGTAEIACAAATGVRPLDAFTAPPLADGWTGKLWAVSRGVARAEVMAHRAKYFLFTDADIVHAPSTLRRLVAKAEAGNLALVSLMARLDARGSWGSLLVPAFVYFFQKLYPFQESNDPKSAVAAAAGGCMLVRRDALEAAGGIPAIRNQLIDDCALARLLKAPCSPAPRRIWIGLAEDEAVSLRDNRKLSAIWNMVARAAFTQLDHSWIKLGGTVAGMLLLYLAPLLGLLAYAWHQSVAAFVLSAAAFALMAVTYRPTCRLYALPIWKTLLLPLAAFFFVLMTIASAVRHARGRGGAWKGRTYPAAS